MEKKKAVSQVKVAPLDVHFLIQVEKLGKYEVSELPNSSANASANSGRDTRVMVRTAQSLPSVIHWSVQVCRGQSGCGLGLCTFPNSENA